MNLYESEIDTRSKPSMQPPLKTAIAQTEIGDEPRNINPEGNKDEHYNKSTLRQRRGLKTENLDSMGWRGGTVVKRREHHLMPIYIWLKIFWILEGIRRKTVRRWLVSL